MMVSSMTSILLLLMHVVIGIAGIEERGKCSLPSIAGLLLSSLGLFIDISGQLGLVSRFPKGMSMWVEASSLEFWFRELKGLRKGEIDLCFIDFAICADLHWYYGCDTDNFICTLEY